MNEKQTWSLASWRLYSNKKNYKNYTGKKNIQVPISVMNEKGLSFKAIVKGTHNLWVIRDFNIEAKTMCKNKQAIKYKVEQISRTYQHVLRKEIA